MFNVSTVTKNGEVNDVADAVLGSAASEAKTNEAKAKLDMQKTARRNIVEFSKLQLWIEAEFIILALEIRID